MKKSWKAAIQGIGVSSAGLAVFAVGLVGTDPAVAKDTEYKAHPEVGYETGPLEALGERWRGHSDEHQVRGRVFHDRNRNGRLDASEHGIPGVSVSNGRDVVVTDKLGYYALPAMDLMTVFVTKPSGYEVPVDEDNIPQFFYIHAPQGSPPEIQRFAGLEPTGPLPARINFPLIPSRVGHRFKAVVSGDPQPYSNNEISYVRDTLANELARIPNAEFLIIEGDIMGDDLGLFPRFKNVMSIADLPVYMAPGNHDLDFDANSDDHSFDTFKREFGPTYYSFDVGKVHFVVLDNVVYPCEPTRPELAFCQSKTYNGAISEQQMQWLSNDLAHVPMDRLIVLNMHIPLVSFIDRNSVQHSVDNRQALYALLEGRKVLSLAGHTHTLERFTPGEEEPGWGQPTPFPQIIAGAASGSWWSGDFDEEGIPLSYQRLGAPRGYLIFEFDGSEYRDRFKATGKPADKQMSLSFLTPSFRGWYEQVRVWMEEDPDTRTEAPPVNLNEIPDMGIVTYDDLHQGSYLMANVWNSSRRSRVTVQFDERAPVQAVRTRDMNAENTLDPFALRLQMNVLRYALQSTSGNERAQGFEMFRGFRRGPAPPQPESEGRLADQSNHLWQVAVPSDLTPGVHRVTVTTTEEDGHEFTESKTFEVMEDRPTPFARTELFE